MTEFRLQRSVKCAKHPTWLTNLIREAWILATVAIAAGISANTGRGAEAIIVPEINDHHRSVVFTSGAEGYHTYRIPAIIAAGNNDLIAFCEGRKHGAGDAGDIDLLCRRSSDGGETWGPIELIWDEGPNTCGNPCPVVDESTGTIWLLMTHNLGSDRESDIVDGKSEGPRTVWISKSEDHGATWSAPQDITEQCKLETWTWYATGPGAGIQLQRGRHAGRLVIPCDHIEATTKRMYSHVIYSDDHGETWQLGGRTRQAGVNECEVVELSDGRLLLNMRNYDRSTPARQIAFSNDGGETWAEQRHDAALIEPRCQASIRRLRWPEGDDRGMILFSNPASTKARVQMTVRGSNDEGQTWPFKAELYPGSSAYSCLVALPDGSVGCLYEIDNYGQIIFDRFTLNWPAERGDR